MSLPSWNLEKVITWPLLALAFTPLVVTNGTMFPYVFGKTVFIRLAVTVFVFLLTFYLFKSDNHQIKERLDFSFLRKPTFIFVLLFTMSALVSTLFATNPYRAFFGDIERGEGLITSLFLFLFLMGSLMLFKYKDWIDFFRLTLLVGGLVAIDAIMQFIQTGVRAGGGFISNPIFTAGYLLFVMFAAFVVGGNAKEKLWRVSTTVVTILSIIGIGVTESRGVMVGIFVALVSLAIYLLVNGKNMNIKYWGRHWNVRKMSAFALATIFLFFSLFLVTKSNVFWQKIPGFDRLAQISATDISTQTRLIAVGVSLNAVNPSISGIGRFLIGWGPENYDIAYNRNYNPHFFKFEAEWFDRAHNRVLDVLVMQGVIGLLIFLALWVKVFWNGFAVRSREDNRESQIDIGEHLVSMGMIFFTVSYFVQNLFVFDQITTLVPVFVLFGFVIRAREQGGEVMVLNRREFFVGIRVITLFMTGLLSIALVLYAIIPYYQTSNLITGIFSSTQSVSNRIGRMTEPYNYAQAEIRHRLVFLSPNMLGTQEGVTVAARADALLREVVAREPFDPRILESLGILSTVSGKMFQSAELLTQGEGDYRLALELAPQRQELMFYLASNLISQGKIDEAISLAKEIIELEPEAAYGRYYYGAIVTPYDWDGSLGGLSTLEKVFGDNQFIFGKETISSLEIAFIRDMHGSYLYNFEQKKDGASLLKTMRQAIAAENLIEKTQERLLEEGRIREIIPSRVEFIEESIKLFQEKGWGGIDINY
ncbi:MAG: O-antigen ligase family protein [Candidatus Colwellbacteria bacterium]|nr:O-antigen ligase family protein [Candidatus Colwellbacteria bacterium]